MANSKALIFVYNADSGLWNSYLDSMHKIFSPKNYSCQLCAITHGTFGMKKEWSEFITTLPIELKFLHRNEWQSDYNRKDNLPAIFLIENGKVSPWLEADQLKVMRLEELKKYLTEGLQSIR